MDQRKAIFRAKLRETKEKQQRRIDPALVRYNEFDQPTCRVCNITLKSEALWPAHQVSRKHHEAKAAAAKAATGAGSRGNIAKQEQPLESEKQKSSTLPTNFFDNQGTKRQSDGEKIAPTALLSDTIFLKSCAYPVQRAPALCEFWGRVSVASLTLACAMRGDRDSNPRPSGHKRYWF